MRKYINKYLNEKYYIKTSEVGNDGIYPLLKKGEQYEYPVNNKFIIDEIIILFSIEVEEAKLEIHVWAVKKKPDVDLEFFWKIAAFYDVTFYDVTFPIIQRVLAQDLVSVQPMSRPKSNLFYFDYVYGTKSWYKKLWDKIKEFFKQKTMYYSVLDHETRKNQWMNQYLSINLHQQNEL